MLSIILTVIKLIIILGVVATIHEFGHFLFAKLFKMGVNEFSIGFGPKIFQKKHKETMYSLRWIPLGGYCAIEGEDEESAGENSFAKKHPLQKIIVLLAGATFNAILAVIIFVTISFTHQTYNTKIEKLSDNSILNTAGISVGDEIYKVDGKKVKLASELYDIKIDGKKDVEIEYIRNGVKNKALLKDAVKEIGYIGVSFVINDDNTDVTNEIQMVASGGMAASAGIKAGDKILSIDGIETSNSTDIVNIIQNKANTQVNLQIERKGETILMSLTPASKSYFDLGISSTENVKTTLPLAFASAGNNFKSIIGSYGDLFKGKVGVNEMSGIIGIGEVVSKTNGVLEFFNMLAIISLAVGVANIMPFPPLDGGKIVLVLCETVSRKKVPLKVEAIISYIGFGLLILLTLFVTYNDIVRII